MGSPRPIILSYSIPKQAYRATPLGRTDTVAPRAHP